MKLKARTAYDLILEYIRRENLIAKKTFLVTSPQNNDCSLIALARKQLAMAAELVFVHAVLKPADGKKDEVESKL